MTDLKTALQGLEETALTMARLTRSAEILLKSVESQIIGRRVDGRRTGNLKGLYQITDVDLTYDAHVNAHGRKVLANGKLGEQRWDLGTINMRQLGL